MPRREALNVPVSIKFCTEVKGWLRQTWIQDLLIQDQDQDQDLLIQDQDQDFDVQDRDRDSRLTRPILEVHDWDEL